MKTKETILKEMMEIINNLFKEIKDLKESGADKKEIDKRWQKVIVASEFLERHGMEMVVQEKS